MPNRILRDTTDSERITPLTERAELLFYRLIMKADDLGRFHANPERVRVFCFPFGKPHMTEEICESCLKELERAGLILIYKRNSVQYLAIVSFKQRLRIINPKFPEPVGKDKFWLPEFGDDHSNIQDFQDDSHLPAICPPSDGHLTGACLLKRREENRKESKGIPPSVYPEGTDNLKVSSKGEESEKGKPPPIGDGGGDSPDKVPETTKPKTKPKTIPEKPPHDRRAVSDAWVLRFKQHTGSDYAFNGARDGKAISDLLDLFPADKIIETIHAAFDAASQNHQGAFWLKKLNSLSMLASRYNEIVVEITELSKTTPNRPTARRASVNTNANLQRSAQRQLDELPEIRKQAAEKLDQLAKEYAHLIKPKTP